MSDPGHMTPHLLVIEARFYEDIADALYEGAAAVLDAGGVTHERVSVPGVFEIPAVIRMAVRSMDFFAGRRRFDGYVALGCVIRGETTHYDYVCSESARKLQDLACEHTLALGYGIITCENGDQAWARADPKQPTHSSAQSMHTRERSESTRPTCAGSTS